MKILVTLLSLALATQTVFAADCSFVSLAEKSIQAADLNTSCVPIDGSKSCVVHIIPRSYDYHVEKNLAAVPYVIVDNLGRMQGFGNVLIKADECQLQYIQKSAGAISAVRQLKALDL